MNTGDSKKPRLALIAGPTASGKSAMAIELARRVRSNIINGDAMQVYANLGVLTARPSAEEEAEVPHRLFGHIDGAEEYNAARWAEEARAEVTAAHEEGILPIIVGGTGLYMRTLLDGIAPVPEIDPAIRAEIRALPVRATYAALKLEDPEAAHRLNEADTTRVARALEVVRSTGKSLASWQAEKTGGIGDKVALSAFILLPPRQELNARINQRFEDMVDNGAADEVDALLARPDITEHMSVRRAIGVQEIAAWRQSQITREEAIAAGQLASRQYAKRQNTWFRNQPPVTWKRLHSLYNDSNIEYFETFLQDIS